MQKHQRWWSCRSVCDVNAWCNWRPSTRALHPLLHAGMKKFQEHRGCQHQPCRLGQLSVVLRSHHKPCPGISRWKPCWVWRCSGTSGTQGLVLFVCQNSVLGHPHKTIVCLCWQLRVSELCLLTFYCSQNLKSNPHISSLVCRNCFGFVYLISIKNVLLFKSSQVSYGRLCMCILKRVYIWQCLLMKCCVGLYLDLKVCPSTNFVLLKGIGKKRAVWNENISIWEPVLHILI